MKRLIFVKSCVQLLKTCDEHVVLGVFSCESLCIVRVCDGDICDLCKLLSEFLPRQIFVSSCKTFCSNVVELEDTVMHCVLCTF